MSYYLRYGLGIEDISNKAADRGTITHKALELLARKKLAIQEGKLRFADQEIDREYALVDLTPELAIEHAYYHYTTKIFTTHEWKPVDFKTCRKLLSDALAFNNGMFDPCNRKIVCPEQYFDYTIDEPWAKYEFNLLDGTVVTGQLAVRGTIDLVTEIAPGVLEYVDYKTGKCKDWATDELKDYKKLRDDFQLRLYHYALTRLYPDKEIIVTIFYIADGGPRSICYEKDDVKVTLEKLRRRFVAIQTCTKPKRIIDNRSKRWKCKAFCHFGKHNWPGTDETICDYIHKETVALGMDRVFEKYADKQAVLAYGSGGGVSDRESKTAKP